MGRGRRARARVPRLRSRRVGVARGGAVRDGSTGHRRKLLSGHAGKHTHKARRPGRRARPFLDPVTGPRRPTTRSGRRVRGSQSGAGRRPGGASRSRRQHRSSALARAGDHHFAGLNTERSDPNRPPPEEPALGRSARVVLDSLPPILPPKALFAPSKVPFCREKASTATGIRTRVSAVRGRRPSPLDDSGEDDQISGWAADGAANKTLYRASGVQSARRRCLASAGRSPPAG
jgi:hypothetical protein